MARDHVCKVLNGSLVLKQAKFYIEKCMRFSVKLCFKKKGVKVCAAKNVMTMAHDFGSSVCVEHATLHLEMCRKARLKEEKLGGRGLSRNMMCSLDFSSWATVGMGRHLWMLSETKGESVSWQWLSLPWGVLTVQFNFF